MSAQSVAVLVELVRGPDAGGHMKCWERFAEAAAGLNATELGIDLTVYVLGAQERIDRLSPSVRFVSLRPVVSTAPLMRVSGGADVSDLAPHHPRLARLLPAHDVWHLTHVFGFATTAVRLARARRRSGGRHAVQHGGMPPPGLVGSVHTDVPALAAAYLHALTGPYRLPGTVAAGLVRHRRDRVLRACDRVLVATPEQRGEVAVAVPDDRIGLLDRGVDHDRFRPDPSARAELGRLHGIPPDRPAVLFSGRADASKRVLVLADALRRLRADGVRSHLVVAGSGPDEAPLRDVLGRDVTLLGPVPQHALARVYAGCDVFAFPSRSETVGNAVGEAMACHLPVVLPAGARTTRWLSRPGEDGVVVRDDDAAGWATALRPLLERPQVRLTLGEAAGATARGHHRTWQQVLTDDLLPVWRAVAPAVPRSPRPPRPADGASGGPNGRNHPADGDADAADPALHAGPSDGPEGGAGPARGADRNGTPSDRDHTADGNAGATDHADGENPQGCPGPARGPAGSADRNGNGNGNGNPSDRNHPAGKDGPGGGSAGTDTAGRAEAGGPPGRARGGPAGGAGGATRDREGGDAGGW